MQMTMDKQCGIPLLLLLKPSHFFCIFKILHNNSNNVKNPVLGKNARISCMILFRFLLLPTRLFLFFDFYYFSF